MGKQLAPPRLEDWEARLDALLRERRKEPFKWGSVDCALWGADVVAALTGADFGEPFRGKYEDADGAALALREYGAGTIVRTFDRHLKRKPLAFAGRGDLVKAKANEAAPHGAIGVVIGADALFVSDLGLERIGRPLWSIAWKV